MEKIIQGLSVSLHASEFNCGELEHPNKMPFSGIMTWFDVPSDKAVGGSGGKRVVIPSKYGVPALATLKGMAVNFDSILMDRHITENKIGIIEDAYVGKKQENGGVPVYVKGYVFAHDFKAEASQIKEEQKDLGFSYETIDTPVIPGEFNGEPVIVVCDDFTFSGAAILLADKAAYTNTSLAASAVENIKEEDNLTIEEIVNGVVAALESKYTLAAKADDKKKKKLPEGSPEEEAEETPAEEEKEEEVGEGDDSDKKKSDKGKKKLNAESEEKVEEPVELAANAEEVIDFKAQAEELKTALEAANGKIAKIEADLKAEADAKEANSHKGFAYPTTLVAKYNLDASADNYEAKIAAVDARTDINTDEKMALKFELRAAELKSNK